MSFFDDLPPFISSSPPYASTTLTDAIVLSAPPQFPVNNEPFLPHSQSDDHDQISSESNNNNNHSNALPCPPRMAMMMHPQNNRNTVSDKLGTGAGHIFFKTRMCTRFRIGTCRNGENCNFAHGVEDMRQPPPNWQEIVGLRGGNEEHPPAEWDWDDDQKIIHKMKLCKKYCNGEECPYGERCNFLHENPSKFRDDSGRIRESSVIRIGTNESPKSNGEGYDYSNSESNKAVVMNNVGLNAYKGKMRSTFWKTKLCIKWETTGQCPFGEGCNFAHGQSELQVLGGRIDTEAAISVPVATHAPIPTLPKVETVPVVDVAPPLPNIASAPPLYNIASAPPLCNIASAPPLRNIASEPPLRNIPSEPPLHNIASAPPLRNIASAPPLHNIASAPPLRNIASAPPLCNIPSAPPLCNIASAPPLCNIASEPPLRNIASAPPLRNIPSAPLANEVEPGKKSLLKWKGPKKINKIYGDWLDDVPFMEDLPSIMDT